MRIFITGSTGLLGNNLVRLALAAGHDVVGLTRSGEKFAKLFADDPLPAGRTLRAVEGDMCEISSFVDVLAECDAVVHTAAYFREYYGPGDHAAALQAINVDATLALMAEADRRGVASFVHVGSAGAVGMRPDGTPGDEQTPPDPRQMQNGYFRSKRDGEEALRRFVPSGGMRVMEVLPGWMWGPGDAAPTAAGKLVLDLMAGRLPGVPEGGTCVVDARDVAAAILRMLEQPKHAERFIVGGEFRTLVDVVRAAAEHAAVPSPRRIPVPVALTIARCSELWARLVGGAPLVPVEGVRVMSWRKQVSSEKARTELGVQFRPFAETARDTVQWLRGRTAAPA